MTAVIDSLLTELGLAIQYRLGHPQGTAATEKATEDDTPMLETGDEKTGLSWDDNVITFLGNPDQEEVNVFVIFDPIIQEYESSGEKDIDYDEAELFTELVAEFAYTYYGYHEG